jgi:hypothetical protein
MNFDFIIDPATDMAYDYQSLVAEVNPKQPK